MSALAVLGLLTTGLLLASLGGDDDIESEEDPAETPEDPDLTMEPDLGATFSQDGDTITIDVGDDETGTIAAIRTETTFTDRTTEPSEDRVIQTNFDVRFYLVPEGVDFPPSVDSVIASLPLDQQDAVIEERSGAESLPHEVYLNNLGAEEIGRVDLGEYSVPSGTFNAILETDPTTDTRVDTPDIISNTEIAAYELNLRDTANSYDDDDEVYLTVSGAPLFDVDVADVAARDPAAADVDIAFENGVIDVDLDPEVEGQLIALQIDTYYHGNEADRGIQFYVLPEGAEFPISVEDAVEKLPPDKSFQYTGAPDQTYLYLHDYMLAVGAEQVGDVDVGGFGSIYSPPTEDAPYGTYVPYDNLEPFTITANREFDSYLASETITPGSAFVILSGAEDPYEIVAAAELSHPAAA